MNEHCPYCKQVLDKIPRRKTVCRHCGNPIYVRTKRMLFPSPGKRDPEPAQTLLLTDHQVAAWELVREDQVAAWELFKELSAVYDPDTPMGRFCVQSHRSVTIDDYHAAQEQLVAKLGREPYATEVVWRLAKKAAQEEIANGVSTIYHRLAIMLYRIGHDHIPVQRKHFEQSLILHKNSGVVKSVTIVLCQEACEKCKQQEGKVLSIDDALKTMPVPCIGCTTTIFNKTKGWCRCDYEVNLTDD